MKLLFFVEHFSMSGSGAENDAVFLCRALAERGHEVHVCCEDGRSIPDVHIHKGLGHARQLMSDLKPEKSIDWGFFHPADIYRLGGGLHGLYLHYYLQAFPRWMRPIKKAEFRWLSKHRRQIAYENRLIRRPGTCCLAISRLVADQTIAAGVPPARVRLLYNGVDLQRFANMNPKIRRHVRATWKAAPDETVFLFVAHNLRLKNLKLLIDVFDRLTCKRNDLKLVVCSKRQPIAKRSYLVHAGVTDTIENYYWAADALLHPTYFDAFGNVVLEAMAAGLPVVVSENAGAAELVDPGKTGLVGCVDKHNETRLWWRSNVEILADAPDYRSRLGQAAQKKCEAYSTNAYVQAFESHLKSSCNV